MERDNEIVLVRIRVIAIAVMALFVALYSEYAVAENSNLDSDAYGSSEIGTAPKGKYIFVPDSLEKDVITVLMGNSKVVDDDSKFDSSERVTWKGDTLPMKLRTRNLGRYDRGLFNYLFIPKGDWSFGLTASYGEFSSDNLEMLSLLNDIDINAHIFSINPYITYFIRNNLSVGLKFGYTAAKGAIDSFKVDIDDDMNFNLHDIMYKNESYSAAFIIRQYIGLTRKGRFGVFNEVELNFASGTSDFQRPFDGSLRNTHTTYMKAGLNFSPGVSIFIMKNASFNLSFGIFGLNLKHETQYEDGVRTGNRTTSGANFRFNLFNINFGVAINI